MDALAHENVKKQFAKQGFRKIRVEESPDLFYVHLYNIINTCEVGNIGSKVLLVLPRSPDGLSSIQTDHWVR